MTDRVCKCGHSAAWHDFLSIRHACLQCPCADYDGPARGRPVA